MFLGLSIPNYFREYSASALHGPSHTRAGWVRKNITPIYTSISSIAKGKENHV